MGHGFASTAAQLVFAKWSVVVTMDGEVERENGRLLRRQLTTRGGDWPITNWRRLGNGGKIPSKYQNAIYAFDWTLAPFTPFTWNPTVQDIAAPVSRLRQVLPYRLPMRLWVRISCSLLIGDEVRKSAFHHSLNGLSPLLRCRNRRGHTRRKSNATWKNSRQRAAAS